MVDLAIFFDFQVRNDILARDVFLPPDATRHAAQLLSVLLHAVSSQYQRRIQYSRVLVYVSAPVHLDVRDGVQIPSPARVRLFCPDVRLRLFQQSLYVTSR